MKTILALVLLCASSAGAITTQECRDYQVHADKYARVIFKEVRADGSPSLESIDEFCKGIVVCDKFCHVCKPTEEPYLHTLAIDGIADRCTAMYNEAIK